VSSVNVVATHLNGATSKDKAVSVFLIPDKFYVKQDVFRWRPLPLYRVSVKKVPSLIFINDSY